MADWNLKRALRPIPQPYKAYVVRMILPFFFLVDILISAAIEGFDWCKEMAEEVAAAWRDVRTH